MTLAWVFSGGGNLGALEAGAIRALLEAGHAPDMLAGVSAGASNAIAIAAWPDYRGVELLWKAWANLDKDDVFPGSFVHWGWNLISGAESLTDGMQMKQTISRWIPKGYTAFRDLEIPCWIVATNARTGRPAIIGGPGDDTALVDGAMASAALPGMVPPFSIGGRQFIDGGVVANVPITSMVDRGANTIYAVSVIAKEQTYERATTWFPALVAMYNAVKIMQLHHLHTALQYATRSGVSVRYLALSPSFGLTPWDFSVGERLLSEGYESAKKWLKYV